MDTDLFLQVDKKIILYNLINLKQLVFEVTDACNLRYKYCGYYEIYKGYDIREGIFDSVEIQLFARNLTFKVHSTYRIAMFNIFYTK